MVCLRIAGQTSFHGEQNAGRQGGSLQAMCARVTSQLLPVSRQEVTPQEVAECLSPKFMQDVSNGL